MVMTDMAQNIPQEFLSKAMNETALGRFATSEECADLVAFLCSDRARHITGEVIKIDGGQYM
jgi:NAD(P)-dependent dehydrogenase (short-subunit alcohol dehydrogenase family)